MNNIDTQLKIINLLYYRHIYMKKFAATLWQGQPAALGTMHSKETIIAPLMMDAFGMEVVVPEGFNSDRFGTFTREVRRPDNQLETARHKALAAMAHTGLELGLASEGSFALDPRMPFITSNLELVILIDKKNDFEIVGHYRTTDHNAQGKEIYSTKEALDTAITWGFPHVGVILRISQKGNRHIYKNIETEAELLEIADRLLKKMFVSSLYLETDLRAHKNPKRQASITLATIDLINNCRRLCPSCQAPGFVVTSQEAGLPCEACYRPTDLVKTTTTTCSKCLHKAHKASTSIIAPPAACTACNP